MLQDISDRFIRFVHLVRLPSLELDERLFARVALGDVCVAGEERVAAECAT